MKAQVSEMALDLFLENGYEQTTIDDSRRRGLDRQPRNATASPDPPPRDGLNRPMTPEDS
jgi:hypothetical protein